MQTRSLAPPCNLLRAGFPCQPFSSKGLGRGARDGRGVVIQWILMYGRLCKPSMLLLENVKGLVQKHSGVLEDIVLQLEQIGYMVSWRLMEAHLFSGIPHKRPRIFIMALDHLNDGSSRWTAPGGRRRSVLLLSGRDRSRSSGLFQTCWIRCRTAALNVGTA